MSIDIRNATHADLPAFMTLRRIWAEETDGPAQDPDFEDRFTDWFERTVPTRRTWIAYADGVPVGMMSMGLFERVPKPDKPQSFWGYLSTAFVVPEARNAGVGRLLLDAVLDHARSEGFARVVLHPSDRAIPFYHRAGFGPADMLLVQHF